MQNKKIQNLDSTEVQTNKTGVIAKDQQEYQICLLFRGMESNKSQQIRKITRKLCVSLGTINITTTPPHSTIKQVTIQIPKVRANHKPKKTFL
jgi:hypothetical protein